MRWLRRALAVYLIVYYGLLAGALLTLWRAGLIDHLNRTWTIAAAALAAALGAVLWVSFRESSQPPDPPQ